MLGRKGLYNSRAVLDDLSREVLYFAPAAGPLPETGLDMKINKLADGRRPDGQDGVRIQAFDYIRNRHESESNPPCFPSSLSP